MKPGAGTDPTAATSQAGDIRDIHGLVAIPSPWGLLPWLAAGLVVATAALLIGRRLRRAAARPPAPTPDTVALLALERARAWMTPAQGERFSVAVSSAIRGYIEARFDVRAPRRTTDEFLRDLAGRPAPDLSPHVAGLEELLRRMDLVKFARQPLDAPQMEALHRAACDFVRATRRPSAAPEPSA